MIEFHGWEMPLQYSGIVDEHTNTQRTLVFLMFHIWVVSN
jgi:glycine cleavage system aminomethyltransferase T